MVERQKTRLAHVGSLIVIYSCLASGCSRPTSSKASSSECVAIWENLDSLSNDQLLPGLATAGPFYGQLLMAGLARNRANFVDACRSVVTSTQAGCMRDRKQPFSIGLCSTEKDVRQTSERPSEELCSEAGKHLSKLALDQILPPMRVRMVDLQRENSKPNSKEIDAHRIKH